LLASGYISATDFNLFDIVDNIDVAVAKIDLFYKRYHSIRYLHGKALLRLNTKIEDDKINALKEKFADILTANGDMCLSGPFPQERNEPELSHLPRLAIDFNLNDFGRLKALIDEINQD
jgi:hypothetical protein